MTTFHFKQNDLRRLLQLTLVDAQGNAVDLTDASSIEFHMEGVTLAGSAQFVNKATGQVQYTWASGDTDTAGRYNAEFQITWSDGKPETFPSGGYFVVRIHPELG